MAETVESIHNKIIKKTDQISYLLETLCSIIETIEISKDLNKATIPTGKVTKKRKSKQSEELNNVVFSPINIPSINTIRNKLYISVDLLRSEYEEVFSNYNLEVVEILSLYYQNINQDNITEDYYQILSSGNFSRQLNEIATKIYDFAIGITNGTMIPGLDHCVIPIKLSAGLNNDLKSIKKLYKSIITINVDIKEKKNTIETCECGRRMTVLPGRSEMICDSCKSITLITGTVFEDHQFYSQEGQKTKHSAYDPMRHYRVWMERITARENKQFPDSDLTLITHCLERDGYQLKSPNCRLHCKELRIYLSECKLTKYNNHVPMLLKVLTGKTPPIIDNKYDRKIEQMFRVAIEIYETIDNARNNKPYYPYFIYKIIEQIFMGDPYTLEILKFIHLQGEKTLIKNDTLYKKICAESNGLLTYRPT